jgi:hypothetical protein
MKSKQETYKYVEWLNADVMHEASRNWLSELRFIKDEQHFFQNLIKAYTLQLIDSKHFTNSKKLIDLLAHMQKKNILLIEDVKAHENELLIMVDGIDQLEEEESYKNKHRKLIISISKYIKDYRILKKSLFEVIEDISKHEKQKRLLK